MDELTKEEVLHVARLARIAVSDSEINRYQKELKQLLDDVDKIKEVEINTDDLLITPLDTTKELVVREDEVGEMMPFSAFKENVPAVTGNYVEVPVMVMNNE